jgi:type III restriction enzyme
MSTLSDELAVLRKFKVTFPVVPDRVESNLAHGLRPYQREALERYLQVMERNDVDDAPSPTQLVFNMATGSGKTLIMAAVMLDQYFRGKRNFLFFVNSSNILQKTRSNFVDPSSPKYLFNPQVQVSGKPVAIREVQSFAEAHDDAINIVFLTVQGLHGALTSPRENSITAEDLKEYDLVLLSDEAHHTNVATKSQSALEDSASWELTVESVVASNPKNALFEFSATLDMSVASIAAKYAPRIVYQYGLKEFRLDGYSKDVLVYVVDSNLADRMLHAILISQFRKLVAAGNGITLKPVVLFKSATIIESRANMEKFATTLTQLTAKDLGRYRSKAGPGTILATAFAYFSDRGLELEDLVHDLREDFSPTRTLSVDSKSIPADSQIVLNTLEEQTNFIRAVFAVDMLDEGWDVLNLFDIVRLYDKRDGKAGKPGRTTVREAQLIGRGARYFPFSIDNDTDPYRRKYDANENEPLRALEQLHYHSTENPRYIQELKVALRETGVIDDDTRQYEVRLKKSFLESETYKNGIVWVNRRVTAESPSATSRPILPPSAAIQLASGVGTSEFVFDDIAEAQAPSKTTKRLLAGSIAEEHVIFTSIARDRRFSFRDIDATFGFKSIAALVSALEQIPVDLTAEDHSNLSQQEKLAVISKLLDIVHEYAASAQPEALRGSEQFRPVAIRDRFVDVVRTYSVDEHGRQEFGVPQSSARSAHQLDIGALNWYAYDENLGTDQEKMLVKAIAAVYDTLAEKWEDIYLLRNEKAVTIYSFKDGRGFEPDFLMVANSRVGSKRIGWQIFIEPKGSQFADGNSFELGSEAWKQAFLQDLAGTALVTNLAENLEFKIIGLQFFNEPITSDAFLSELQALR